jgi:hypothetical protein
MTKLQTTAKSPIADALLLTGVLQRKCDCGQHTIAGDQCYECRKEQMSLQGNSQNLDNGLRNSGGKPPIVDEVLRSSGQPLDSQTRAFVEPRFNYDFSHVRVHTNDRAAESAQAVGALAYTVGRNVVFGAGRYEPGSASGMRLLAHELSHTIQQRAASNSPASLRLDLGSADSPAEREADSAEQTLGLAAPAQASPSPSLQRKKWDTLPPYLERPEIINQKNADAAKACPVSATGTLSEVSWGETSGLYPTKDNKYEPEKWDGAKTCELLSARGAVHAIGQRGEKVHKAKPGKDPVEQKLKPYHFIENFPTLDSEISDATVKWFYLSNKASMDVHPTMSTLVSVKKYGPFYNNGGGDVAKGNTYIHFYKKKPSGSK